MHSNDTLQLSFEEVDIIRQWYNAVHDINYKYLDTKDHQLADKIGAYIKGNTKNKTPSNSIKIYDTETSTSYDFHFGTRKVTSTFITRADGALVGMSSAIDYDRNGNEMSRTEPYPTGVIINFS